MDKSKGAKEYAVDYRSIEDLIADERKKYPNAGPEAINERLYSSFVAGGYENTSWLFTGLSQALGRARHEKNLILRDFAEADPGAAAVAKHDSFLRANPHLNGNEA